VEIELFPKQDDFVFDNHRFAGYGGGFGNGKTLSGAIKTYNHCINQDDAFFLIGRRHATDLSDSTQRDFLSWFGHLGKFSPRTNSFKFFDENGKFKSEVIFRHLDDLQSLTNMNLSGFWIDQAEEVSEDAFDFLVGRLRRSVQKREGFITFNMEGHNWIWRRFLKKKDRQGDPLSNASDYFLVTASTLENKDNLPEDYVKSLMAQSTDYVKRFVYGDWDNFAGQIYDEFNPRLHVIRPFTIPAYWEKLRAIDHGQQHATGCLWAAVDYAGNIFIYKEYKKADDVVSNHVKMIKDMSKVQGPKGLEDEKYNYTIIDPATHQKTREKNGYSFSVADEYLDAGIPTLPGQNDVIAGINRVKEYFKIDPEHMHPFLKDEEGDIIKGAPRLYIFSSCVELIEEIQQYKWKQVFGSGTVSANADDIKERPVKRNDDLVDPLRYLIMSRPQSAKMLNSLEPWLFDHPLELARRAQAMHMTVDDLINQRSNKTTIRHSSSKGKIGHRDNLHTERM
jgi:PBSX family phage terminase large subunit